MGKRILGIFLSLLGTTGLIMAAASFVSGASKTQDVKLIAIYAVLGLIFFIAGIGLIRNTKDRPS